MLNPTLTYETENEKDYRVPVHVLEVAGRTYSTHWLFDYFAESMADAPVLYHRYDETSGAVAADSSGNGLNGTLVNTPTLGVTGSLTGDKNKAISFSAASSEHIIVADNPLLDLGINTFSIRFRFKCPTFSGNYTVVDKGVGGYHVYIDQDGAFQRASIVLAKNGTGIICTTVTAIFPNVWYDVTVTKDGADFHIYVNATDVTSTIGDQTIVATADALYIGRTVAGTQYFEGVLDELKLYATALSPARVLALYESALGLRPLTGVSECLRLPRGIAAQIEPERGRSSNGSIDFSLADLSDYDTEVLTDSPSWFLGDAPKSGATWADISGNGLDVTLVNSPTLGGGGLLAGKPNLGVTFNGSTQYGTRADHALLDPGDVFTIEIPVQITTLAGDEVLLDKNTNGYLVRKVGTTGLIRLEKRGIAVIASSTVPLVVGVKTHVAITKNGADVHIYFDGVDVTGVVTNATIAATASALEIGRAIGGTGYSAVTLARLALFPTALSAERIKAHALSFLYNFGTNGQISRLIAEGIEGQSVVYKTGFDNVCFSDFLEYVPDGVVENVRQGDDQESWQVRVSEPLAYVTGQLAQPGATVLDADITDTDTSCQIPVDGAQFFLSSGYFVIDSEIIKYDSKDVSNFVDLTRGMFGTVPASHLAGAAISELIRIGPGHPCDLIQDIYTDTGKTGLGISSTLVDSTKFDAIKALTPGFAMEFRLLFEVNAREFLETELFSKISAYSVIRGGKLSIVQFAEPSVADAEFTDDDIMADGDGKPLVGWEDNFGTLVNSLAYGLDFNPLLDRPETKPEPIEDSGSIAQYGRTPPNSLPVTSLGFRTSEQQTDDFNRANSNSLGANWTESEAYAGAFQVASNQLRMGGGGGGSGNAGNGLAIFGYDFAEIQEVQLTFVSTTTNGKSGAGLRLRGTDSAAYGYAFIYDKSAGKILVKSFTGGAITGGSSIAPMAHTVTLVNGDTVKLRAYRDELSLYVNGVLVASATDSDHEFGGVGLVTQQAEAENQVWDDFAAQDDFANTLDHIADFADLTLSRYASGGAPIVPLRVFPEFNTLEPGDIVGVTSAHIIDKATGQKGVTDALFEVIGREYSAAAGYVDLMLLWTSWNL